MPTKPTRSRRAGVEQTPRRAAKARARRIETKARRIETRTESGTTLHDIEVRVAPGSRGTGIAVVVKLDDKERVLYRDEDEIQAATAPGRQGGSRRRAPSKRWDALRLQRFNALVGSADPERRIANEFSDQINTSRRKQRNLTSRSPHNLTTHHSG